MRTTSLFGILSSFFTRQSRLFEVQQKISWVLPYLNATRAKQVVPLPTAARESNGRNTQLACCLRIPRRVAQSDRL